MLTSLGAFSEPNSGQRYEAYAGYPIITGNPGDEHTVLLPPNGSNRIVCVASTSLLGVTTYPNCQNQPYGTYSSGGTYNIQSDAWSGKGAGTPSAGISIDVEGPQYVNAYLRGNMPEAIKLLNDIEHQLNSSSYIGTGSTWQLGQAIFCMEIGGRENTVDFANMVKMLWSIQSPQGWLPNSYSGFGEPGTGHDPENQDAGLIGFCAPCIANIQNNFGEFNSNSPPN